MLRRRSQPPMPLPLHDYGLLNRAHYRIHGPPSTAMRKYLRADLNTFNGTHTAIRENECSGDEARTTSRPDGKVIGEAGHAEGERPSADAGEKM